MCIDAAQFIMVSSWIITLYTLWQLCSMHEMNGKRFNRYHELGQVSHCLLHLALIIRHGQLCS